MVGRGRPKGTKNKPKEAKPSGSPNGHNANGGITDEQREALAHQHKAAYQRALSAKKDADADFKNACKRIKAELGDHGVHEIKTMIELDTPEGETRIRARLEAELRAAAYMQSPLGTQFTLDVNAVDRTPAVDRAYAEGRRDALASKVAQTDYDPNVEQYRAYHDGHKAGLAEILQGIKQKPPPAAAAEVNGKEPFQEPRPPADDTDPAWHEPPEAPLQ